MDSNIEALQKAVCKAADELSQICDSVVIMACSNNSDCDHNEPKVVSRRGSQYAAYAMVKEEALTWEQYVKTHAAHTQMQDYEDGENGSEDQH